MSASLIERARVDLRRARAGIVGVLVTGVSIGKHLCAVREEERPADALALWLADEAVALMRPEDPDFFGAYLCLEVAAARERGPFGYVFRRYRDSLMRALLGAARREGIGACVRETTPAAVWRGHRGHVWAELREDRLVVHIGDRVEVLDRDLGMREDYDA